MVVNTLETFKKDLKKLQGLTQFETNEVEKYLRIYLSTRFLSDCRYRLAPIDYTFTILENTFQILSTRTIYDKPKELSGDISVLIKHDIRLLYNIDRSISVTNTNTLIITLDKILISEGTLSQNQTFTLRGQISPVDYTNIDTVDLDNFLKDTNRLYHLVLYGTFILLLEGRGREPDPTILALYNRKKNELHSPKDEPLLEIRSRF